MEKGLNGMKVLLKDESLWPCEFDPSTFGIRKLKKFVDRAIVIGQMDDSFIWFNSEKDNYKWCIPIEIPLASKVRKRFLPIFSLSIHGYCNIEQQMQMFTKLFC